MQQPYSLYLLFTFVILVIPEYAQAYIGPGASDSALGTTIVIFGVILLAIVALLWYPLKIFLGKRKKEDINKRKPSP
jgi:hypothetical protein